MDSPMGSRRGTVTSPSASHPRNHFQRLGLADSIPVASQFPSPPIDRPTSAPPPQTPFATPPTAKRKRGNHGYFSTILNQKPNPNLVRELSIGRRMRYSNKLHFDQENLKRLQTGNLEGKEKQSPPTDSVIEKAEQVRWGDIIYELRPSKDCPCGASTYVPVRLATGPLPSVLPGSRKEASEGARRMDAYIPMLDVQQEKVQHDRLCPRFGATEGQADYHWRDRRPMWMPQMSSGFRLEEKGVTPSPKLYTDWEFTKGYVYGKEAVKKT